MIRVSIELSDSSSNPNDRIFTIANWIAATLQQEMDPNVVIHRFDVEEDA